MRFSIRSDIFWCQIFDVDFFCMNVIHELLRRYCSSCVCEPAYKQNNWRNCIDNIVKVKSKWILKSKSYLYMMMIRYKRTMMMMTTMVCYQSCDNFCTIKCLYFDQWLPFLCDCKPIIGFIMFADTDMRLLLYCGL